MRLYRFDSLMAFLFITGLLCSQAFGSSGVGAYLVPHFGYSWNRFHALEIEKSFLGAAGNGEADEEPTEGDRPRVGSKAQYRGGSFTFGVGGGLRLFDLRLGVLYFYASPAVEGYSVTYQYSPEKMRATGSKLAQAGGVDVHRVLADIQYTLPVWRFGIDLKTRIGAVMLRESNMESIDVSQGFSGDFGLGLTFSVLDFLSLGIEGYFGVLSFSSRYKGVYGIVGGLGATIQLMI